jgi:hypothetical protein
MKKFLKTAGLLLLATMGLSALLLASAYAAGTVWVNVEEKGRGGHHIILAVPAVFVPIGLGLVPRDKLREFSREAQPWLPAMRSASTILERCPDTRFVEVSSADEAVEIQKRGDALVIDVDSREDRVHISFPIILVHALAQKLAPFRNPA